MAEALEYHDVAGLDILDVGSGQGIYLCQNALGGANATGIDAATSSLRGLISLSWA